MICTVQLDLTEIDMTVRELIDRLNDENPDAFVYTLAHDDDLAFIVTDVKADILAGKDETVVMIY